MDFKSLINKISSLNDEVKTVAAPELPKAVQLNEDAELRVLAGTSSYLAEAKKKSEEKKEEKVKEGQEDLKKVGDKVKTAHGTMTKTATGLKHERSYGKDSSDNEDDEDHPKDKKAKKAKKESIDPEEFKEKFSKMVEAAKPDFLDLDKDGNKKEPMKKAAADKGSDKKDGKKGMSAKQEKYFGKKNESVEEGSTGDYSAKKARAGKDIGKPGKNFEKIAKKAEKGGAKSGEAVAGAVLKKLRAKESVQSSKKVVAESVEQKLTFKQMVQLVQESGGQQQIDPIDKALFTWAERVAKAKLGEGMKADLYAGLIYERNGGVFEMYDVLSEEQNNG